MKPTASDTDTNTNITNIEYNKSMDTQVGISASCFLPGLQYLHVFLYNPSFFQRYITHQLTLHHHHHHPPHLSCSLHQAEVQISNSKHNGIEQAATMVLPGRLLCQSPPTVHPEANLTPEAALKAT